MSIKRWILCILIGVLCSAIVVGVLVFPSRKESFSKADLSDYSSVSAICELATLRSFYHNVVVYEEEPNTGAQIVNIMLWPIYTKTGYKQFWIEYTGKVDTGIDAGQIRIYGPDAEGVVEVFLPDAKVLSIDEDDESFSKPITEEGLFADISGKDQGNAYSAAQSAMRDEAENDLSMLGRAKNNAKIIIERYIKNTGEAMGADYSVRWIDAPK